MAVRFKLENKTVSTKCYQSLNLLGHAQLEQLNLGSECGGHGVCGKDRIRILEEDRSLVSPPSEEETEHLSADEINEGWRLGCQCFPSADDLEISVEVAFSEQSAASK